MEKLSVTIITLNEERKIRDALESVKWADEIVIVDSGSTDKTLEICRKYTDKVFHQDWPGFVAQKNYATDKASHLWILSIDADERVTPELAEEIKAVLKAPKADAYAIPRRVFYLGRWINYSGWYPDFKTRLFNRNVCRWKGEQVHEELSVNGKVDYLKGDINHLTFDSIADHIKTMNSYTSLAAREQKGRAEASVIHLLFRPFFAFIKSFFLKQGFRDGMPGFIIAVAAACHVFYKYAKLWERNNVKGSNLPNE
ncbi:MAG: glycosyltransferase family 2 protein [Proteobacteria bacterium]|nr:glycosyltransferase family 2 protein [Pseudomonadota bacterium]